MSDEQVIDEGDEITATKYFEMLKAKKQKTSDELLNGTYEVCLTLLGKCQKTGQHDAAKKIFHHLDAIELERKALAAGIDTFIYKNDIEEYLRKVKDRHVRTIELSRYEREIPDEIIEKYEKVKDVFTSFWVLFTDYTEEHTKKTEKERDPILFGSFQDKESNSNVERFYFIGDWIDEYCDLTLDRMLSEMGSIDSLKNKEVRYSLRDPSTIDEMRARLKDLDAEKRGRHVNNNGSYSFINGTNSTSTGVIMPQVVLLDPSKQEVINKDQEKAPEKEPEKKNFIKTFFSSFGKK